LERSRHVQVTVKNEAKCKTHGKKRETKTNTLRHVLTFSQFPPSQSFSYRNQKPSRIINIFRDLEEETKAKTLTQRRNNGRLLFTTRTIVHLDFRNCHRYHHHHHIHLRGHHPHHRKSRRHRHSCHCYNHHHNRHPVRRNRLQELLN